VESAQFSRQIVVARSSPNSGEFVGRNCHTDSRTADEDASIDFPDPDLSRYQDRDIRVIARTIHEGPYVDHFVAEAVQHLDHFGPNAHAPMIATDGYLHG